MFEMVLRFTVGGPAVTGEWGDGGTAVRKFRGFVGLYGDHATATITLTSSGPARPRLLRRWTHKRGEEVFAP
ncbi:hypothetical protein ACIO6T_30510 [Streptomyces sp. NPDC087532]|uniref:hypothetical protein n=1 Tax=Streptomyces sp. NPDC087532 TaxID=3365795 RepID=UPI00381C35D1